MIRSAYLLRPCGKLTMQQPQTVVLPLHLDTQVFSGIAPPRELLEAMAEAKTSVRRTSTAKTSTSHAANGKLEAEGRKQSASAVPSSSAEASGSSGAASVPSQQENSQALMYSDAPPSYEDAIASNLPPVDAPRPDYAPPPPGEDDVLRGDEKKRRDS